MLRKIASLQERVQGIASLRVSERARQELTIEQPQECIGKSAMELTVERWPLLQVGSAGDVRAFLAIARTRQQQHVPIRIGRRRWPSAGRRCGRRRIGAGYAEVAHMQ